MNELKEFINSEAFSGLVMTVLFWLAVYTFYRCYIDMQRDANKDLFDKLKPGDKPENQ